MNQPRRIATLAHRWTGLALAGFLIVVGLTGAIIAWNDELERVFAPSLFLLPPVAVDTPALDLFTLREMAEKASGGAVNGIDWTHAEDAPALFSIEARPGAKPPENDQIALDPATGRVLGERRYGAISQGTVNLLPFIYQLHDTLLLGDTGVLILGVVALLWTIDCFIGAYLTFPSPASRMGWSNGWLTRWRPAWAVRWRARGYRLLYDLHRAGGLWPWAMLFVLAWSGVGFNLPQVYRPVMALAGVAADFPTPPAHDPSTLPRIGWRAAHARGQVLMAAAAAREGFTIVSERLMFYDPATHIYAYRVLSSRDPGFTGNTQVKFDGDSGRLVELDIPTGRAAGDTISAWIFDIHVGDVFGMTMKLLLTVVGVAVAALSVTGVLIWWRKTSALSSRARRRAVDRS